MVFAQWARLISFTTTTKTQRLGSANECDTSVTSPESGVLLIDHNPAICV
jgi:hypothetical protein